MNQPNAATRLTLAETLVVARRRANLSASAIADQIGVSPGTIVSWEWGRTRPGPSHLDDLLDVLERNSPGDPIISTIRALARVPA